MEAVNAEGEIEKVPRPWQLAGLSQLLRNNQFKLLPVMN